MLTIDLIEDIRSPITADQFQAALQPVSEQSFSADATIEILLTNDEQMQELNRRHRGVDATTDVLSLPTAVDSERGAVAPCSTPGVEHPVHLGTIAISLPQAERQVGHFGPTLRDELLELATHGFRHLLGHDHNEAGEWIQAQ